MSRAIVDAIDPPSRQASNFDWSSPSDPASNEKWAKWRQRMDEVYGKAECIIGKQRHGPIGKVELAFDANVTRFGNLSHDQKGYSGDFE